jgi:hypothetical protein
VFHITVSPSRQPATFGDEDVVRTDQPKEAVMLEVVQRLRGLAVGHQRTVPALHERETQIFGLAAITIVAYRLDDAFIQMNPGTSASDHLGSGALPAGLIGIWRALFSVVRQRCLASAVQPLTHHVNRAIVRADQAIVRTTEG